MILPKDSRHVPVNGGTRCGLMRDAMSHHDFVRRLREERSCSTNVLHRKVGDDRCHQWGCGVSLVHCEASGGSDWPGAKRKFDICYSAPGNFPYSEQIWTFFEENVGLE